MLVYNPKKTRFKHADTSRQTIMTVRVVQLPVLEQRLVIRLRWWLDVEKRSGMLSSLLSAPKCVCLFASICRKQQVQHYFQANVQIFTQNDEFTQLRLGIRKVFTVHFLSCRRSNFQK